MSKYDFYCLVMFPYPSGRGLHIGHYYNYAIMDSYCNMLRYKGLKVFQPFGYDAFGLPAENYAKSVGGDPQTITYENINKFRDQMARMNTKYEEKFATCYTTYQHWTQWLFLKLKENGLAYKSNGVVNWCVTCGTVLANEQVIPFDPQFPNGPKKCERCGFQVRNRTMEQWYFKMTAYKDRLIKNLDGLDYPKSTIEQQRHWLENLHDWCVSRQRKWGCPIPLPGENDTLDTFVDSSFYFLRYLDPENTDDLLDPAKYHQPDLYVGGSEHACMHLIYARFIHMFLYDLGLVKEEEPFKRVVHQGMIMVDREKMSKRNNAASPDDYDPDTLRFYLMQIGPYLDGGTWSDKDMVGVERFKERFKTWMAGANPAGQVINVDEFQEKIFDLTEKFKFNKVVSEFMSLVKNRRHDTIDIYSRDRLVELLKIYMPGFEV